MKAFVVEEYKKKGALKLVDLAVPKLNAKDVLIEVHAAAVNLLDSKVRDGEFKIFLHYRPPFGIGHDVAGVVKSIGSEVTRFRIGDKVYSRPRDYRQGTFAEFIAVDEADIALIPNNLNMIEAASIPLVGLTAWQALVENGNLRAGQKVFIQAGSGGVGTFAIQLAKHLGAFVATTASTRNFSLVKGLGADTVIDYNSQNFEEILSDYDLVLNSQDSATLMKSLSILKRNGMVLSISGPPDPAFAEGLGLNPILKLVMRLLSFKVRNRAKKLGLHYSFLFMRANGHQLEEISKLIEAGKIKPVIDRVFPFAESAEALKYVETGRANGKVVIDMGRG